MRKGMLMQSVPFPGQLSVRRNWMRLMQGNRILGLAVDAVEPELDYHRYYQSSVDGSAP